MECNKNRIIMKKLVLLLAAALCMMATTEAQIFKYGLKAGIGFSNLRMEDITGISDGGDVYNLVTGDAVMGYHFGVQTRIKIAMLFIQPEAYFDVSGGTVEKVLDNGATEILNTRFSRIEIPLLLGVKLGPVRINAGPAGSIILSESTDLTELQPDFTLFENTMTWGFQAGLGVDLFKKLSIDARYEGSLSKLGESLSIGESEFALDARPSVWVLSLGVWF
jgi:hypothetical protein